jgi:hypothetical protein
MKIGSVNVGWTEALLAAKQVHRESLENIRMPGLDCKMPGVVMGFLSRFGAIGSVVKQAVGQHFGFRSEALQTAMRSPGNFISNVLGNRAANAATNLTGGDGLRGAVRNIRRGIRDFGRGIMRGVRNAAGQATAGDRAAGAGNEFEREFNNITGGTGNIKDGLRNLWRFIKA